MQQDAEHQLAVTDDDGRSVLKSNARVSLSNFSFIKVLGKGSFGKVCIAPNIHH